MDYAHLQPSKAPLNFKDHLTGLGLVLALTVAVAFAYYKAEEMVAEYEAKAAAPISTAGAAQRGQPRLAAEKTPGLTRATPVTTP